MCSKAALRKVLTTKMVKLLNPEPRNSQFQRHQYFVAGLNEVAVLWKDLFKVTSKGLGRAFWFTDPKELEKVIGLQSSTSYLSDKLVM